MKNQSAFQEDSADTLRAWRLVSFAFSCVTVTLAAAFVDSCADGSATAFPLAVRCFSPLLLAASVAIVRMDVMLKQRRFKRVIWYNLALLVYYVVAQFSVLFLPVSERLVGRMGLMLVLFLWVSTVRHIRGYISEIMKDLRSVENNPNESTDTN